MKGCAVVQCMELDRFSCVISINMYVDSTSITTLMIVYVNHHHHLQHRLQRSFEVIRVSSHPADSQYDSQNTHLDTRSSLVCGVGRGRRSRWFIRAGASS